MSYGKAIAVVVLMALNTLAVGAADCIKCGNPLSADESDVGFCFQCGFLVPEPEETQTWNGVAVYNFGADLLGFDVAPIFAGEIANTRKFEAAPLKFRGSEKYSDYKNITNAFRDARCAQQQLVLVGAVSKSDGLLCISAEVFDIETGHRVGFGNGDIKADSSSDTAAVELKVREFAAALARGLPYRGRYRRIEGKPTFFEFASGLKRKRGGRVEVYKSYDYLCREETIGEGDNVKNIYWFDLTPVAAKVVITESDKLEITPGREGKPGRITITGEQFDDDDICYYYYPPEIPPVERWASFGCGASITTHSYNYTEDLKSRENGASVGLTFTRRFRVSVLKQSLPLRWGVGATCDAPLNYRYEYDGVYQDRGRIMGVYVVSSHFAIDWAPLGTKRWFELWLGGEADYFFSPGHGVYELEAGGYETYESELWQGLLLGVRVEWVPLYFGPRKRIGVALKSSYSWPVSGNHGEHFGPLWRIPSIEFRYDL